MTNIPKSPLEVSHITETQRLETELVCSSSIECEACGVTTTDWHVCSKCQRKVCANHLDSVRGICSDCKTNLDTENQDYHEGLQRAELERLAKAQQAEADYNIEDNAEPQT